jgi:cytochrome c553
MTQVAAKLNDREIRALADYIAGLRPSLPGGGCRTNAARRRIEPKPLHQSHQGGLSDEGPPFFFFSCPA